jgi:hypothetical protein
MFQFFFRVKGRAERGTWHNAHKVVDMSAIETENRNIDLNIEAWICKTAITLDLTGNRVDIAQIGWRALYLAANKEYNAHWIDNISAVATEICRIEYYGLNMQNCNYIGFDRDQC